MTVKPTGLTRRLGRLLTTLTLTVVGVGVLVVATAAQNGSSFTGARSSVIDYGQTPWRAAVDCRSLRSQTTDDYSIIIAEPVAGTADIPEHCRVSGVIPPEIRFEVDLPTEWNGRFYMHGNGGYAGGAPDESGSRQVRGRALRYGFATAHTDTGHDRRVEPGASFALNNLQKTIDYGFRAVHLTTVTAKTLVRQYYEREASFAYWDGCSTGGRQGLISAQRFPDDFDGIVAGAPVLDFSGTMIWGAWNGKAVLESGLTLRKMSLVAEVVYARCDALDGLEDGLIDDPRLCDFVPRDHLTSCADSGGGDRDGCFSEAEVTALEKIYGGVISNGKRLFPGQPVGAEIENGWQPWVIPSAEGVLPAQTRMSENYFKYLAFPEDDPSYDWRSFDFDTDPNRIGLARQIIDAVDPDLAAFRDRGGKMIGFFGWADTALNPMMGINYYEDVMETMEATTDTDARDFYRFFMVPGMFHCRGGVGTDRFDAMTPLVNWVEGGTPPPTLRASQWDGDRLVRSRPLCPYPQVARYTGSGSVDDAANFACSNP